MAEALAPVDTSVQIPASVKHAAELAEAAHKAAYGDSISSEKISDPEPPPLETPQEQIPQEQATPQEVYTRVPPASPEVPIPTKTELAEDSWAARYNSMRGRWETAQQTIGSMQEQMQQLGDELMRTQRMLQQPRQQQSQPKPQPKHFITDKDVEQYGPELLDVIRRAALETVAPDIEQLHQSTQQVRQRVAQQTTQTVYQKLESAVPNWEEINNSPRFKQWASLRDVYSGAVRGKMLNDALQAADAPRVIAFFKGFLAEEQATGQAPAPLQEAPQAPRVAAIPLDTIVAPGRPRPAPGNSSVSPVEKPIFTRAQVSEFYANVRKGAYAGRDADKAAHEAMIFAAQNEGRIR